MHLPVTYIRIFVGALDLGDAERRDVLRAAEISPREIEGTDHYVDFEVVRRLLRVLDRRLPAGWHVDVAGRMDVAHHGPLGIAAITAPTLGASLEVLTRFGEIRGPFAWVEIRAQDDPVRLRYHEVEDLGELRPILMETMMLTGMRHFRH